MDDGGDVDVLTFARCPDYFMGTAQQSALLQLWQRRDVVLSHTERVLQYSTGKGQEGRTTLK